jgi:hypothetical protein
VVVAVAVELGTEELVAVVLVGIEQHQDFLYLLVLLLQLLLVAVALLEAVVLE